MKKFLLLPLLLAVGFGVLIVLTSMGEEGYITTPSGLKYKDLKVGDGKEVKPGATVTVHYTGWLKDGKEFDKSGVEPVTFSLNEVVPGWQEGIPGMKVGGKRKLIVPAELGYGAAGSPPNIPPNAPLTFEVEVVDVK